MIGRRSSRWCWSQGAHLDAPADPSSADYPARPEWYFLSLYQMLKYFPGNREVIGTIVIPSTLLFILILLPLLDRVLPAAGGPFLGLRVRLRAWWAAAGVLTVQALRDDAANAQFHEAREQGRRRARAGALAGLACPRPASLRTARPTSCAATR